MRLRGGHGTPRVRAWLEKQCAAVCRDAEVLSLFAAIINKLSGKMEAEVPRIFEAVFECTLQMITRNFEVLPQRCIAHWPCCLAWT